MAWGGRGNVGVSAPWRVHGVPAVCPIQDAMDGLSSGYHVHSSLQRPAPHVSMRGGEGGGGGGGPPPPPLAPIKGETQPLHRLHN
jgi:hypothetical protein